MLFAVSIFLKYVIVPLLMVIPILISYFYCKEKKEPALYSAWVLGMLLGVGLNVLNLWPDLFSTISNEESKYVLASIAALGFIIMPIIRAFIGRFVFIDSMLVLIMSGVGFTLFSSYSVFDNEEYKSYFIAGILSFTVGILIYVMLFHRKSKKY